MAPETHPSVSTTAPRVRCHPGRDLVLSPEWGHEEPSALFDRNSGDYWIITHAARRLVQAAMTQGSDAGRVTLPPSAAPADIAPVIDELVELGILQPLEA